MLFRGKTLSLLITATSTLYAPLSNASHTEVGYRDGLMMSTLVRIDKIFYMQVEKYNNIDSFGAGIGYDFGPLNTTLLVSELYSDNTTVETQLQGIYYDVKFSYSAAIIYNSNGEMGYKVGVGYGISEKLSAVFNYSDKGAFIGIRRWF